MSMIFDNFPTMADAEAFVIAAKGRFGLEGRAFATDEEAQHDDWFPGVRRPYIAHVDRIGDDGLSIDEAVAAEERVEVCAPEFGGEFIGT